MSINERWLPVVGYENAYEVSSQGRVRSLTRLVKCGAGVGQIPGRELKAFLNAGRYPAVKLSLEGSKTTYAIHRLMLEAFVGTCPTGMECCHSNDISTDNRLENLRWDSRSGNMHDLVRNGNHNQAKKVYCQHGHEFTAENTIARQNWRQCRACKNNDSRRRYAGGRTDIRSWNRRVA